MLYLQLKVFWVQNADETFKCAIQMADHCFEGVELCLGQC